MTLDKEGLYAIAIKCLDCGKELYMTTAGVEATERGELQGPKICPGCNAVGRFSKVFAISKGGHDEH